MAVTEMLTSLGPWEPGSLCPQTTQSIYNCLQRLCLSCPVGLGSGSGSGSGSDSGPLGGWPCPASPAVGSLGAKVKPHQLPCDPTALFGFWCCFQLGI